MNIVYHIAFGIHLLCVIAILVLLLLQVKKSPKKLNPGVVHATLTAFIAGVVMVGLYEKVNTDEVAIASSLKVAMAWTISGVCSNSMCNVPHFVENFF
jgi:predicted anti-sigma-YlaC factor YlaD